MRKVKVYKYHSCENVFLIIDYVENVDFSLMSEKLCNDLNADGLLIFKNDPMQMIVFNKDGTEANMCGNGIRCLMNYIYDRFGIYNFAKIKTKSGNYNCEIVNKEPFVSSVSLGAGNYPNNIIKKDLIIKDKTFYVTLFELGVPHLIVPSSNFTEDEKYIKHLFEHNLFSEKVNINLVNPLSRSVFEMITYEKGVGFTKSCGTGAAASAYILHTEYEMDNNLVAVCPGGILKVDIEEEIILTGESSFIEEYEIKEWKFYL